MLRSLLSSPRFPRNSRRTSPWRAQGKLRSEKVGREPYRSSARPACWQSRAAHRPLCRQSMHRPRTPHRFPPSRSVRRNSPTSTWRRSTSWTRKTSSSATACNLHNAAVEAAAAGAAQREVVGAAAAAVAEAARCDLDPAAVEAVAAPPAAGSGRAGPGSGSARAGFRKKPAPDLITSAFTRVHSPSQTG